MQVAFFLTPKSATAYLLDSFTLRQALEKMEYHHYSAMPVVDADGRYQYTLLLNDCLRIFKNNPHMTFADAEKIALRDIERRAHMDPVNISATMTDLLDKTLEQNFIPVVDDQGIYIGVVRRRAIIEYCMPLLLDLRGKAMGTPTAQPTT